MLKTPHFPRWASPSHRKDGCGRAQDPRARFPSSLGGCCGRGRGAPSTPRACVFSGDQHARAETQRTRPEALVSQLMIKGLTDAVPIAKLLDREGVWLAWAVGLLGGHGARAPWEFSRRAIADRGLPRTPHLCACVRARMIA